MTKQQAISKMILDKATSIASVNGWAANDIKAVKQAFDFVLGEGAYDRLASDLYHSLRGEAV